MPRQPARRLPPRMYQLMVIVAVVAGCSPAVSVTNGAPFQVRAIVSGDGGTRNVQLIPAGGSVTADIPDGPYAVAIVPEEQWAAAAVSARDAIAARLGNPDLMGPEEVAAVARELDELSARLTALSASAPADARCTGTVGDGTATAEIRVEPDGRIVVACSGPPASPAPR